MYLRFWHSTHTLIHSFSVPFSPLNERHFQKPHRNFIAYVPLIAIKYCRKMTRVSFKLLFLTHSVIALVFLWNNWAGCLVEVCFASCDVPLFTPVEHSGVVSHPERSHLRIKSNQIIRVQMKYDITQFIMSIKSWGVVVVILPQQCSWFWLSDGVDYWPLFQSNVWISLVNSFF